MNPDNNNNKTKSKKLCLLLFGLLVAAAACVPFLYFLIKSKKNKNQKKEMMKDESSEKDGDENNYSFSALDEFLFSEECSTFFQDFFGRLEYEVVNEGGSEVVIEIACNDEGRANALKIEEQRAAAIAALREEDVNKLLTCPLAYALKLGEIQPLYLEALTKSYDTCKEEMNKELEILQDPNRRALLLAEVVDEPQPSPRGNTRGSSGIGHRNNNNNNRFLQFWGGCDFFDDDDYVGTSSVVNHMTPGVYDVYFWIACDSGIIGTNCSWDDDEWDYNEILAFLGGR